MILSTRFLTTFFGALLSCISPSSVAETAIKVHDAWIREGPPTATVLAAYLDIENQTNTILKLIGADSPSFERIEIHRTEMKNGIARMHPQKVITLSPLSRMVFSPGNYHLMLVGPKGPLRAGATVELELQFEDGSTYALTVIVRTALAHDPYQHKY